MAISVRTKLIPKQHIPRLQAWLDELSALSLTMRGLVKAKHSDRYIWTTTLRFSMGQGLQRMSGRIFYNDKDIRMILKPFKYRKDDSLTSCIWVADTRRPRGYGDNRDHLADWLLGLYDPLAGDTYD